MINKNKGQTLVITLFIVLVSLTLTLVFLMPINQQVVKLRKLLNTFQSLAYSESGIEFANYYALKGEVLGGFTTSTASSSFSGSLCEHFANKLNLNISNYDTCIYTTMTSSTLGTVEIYSSINSVVYVAPYIKVISGGKFENILRVLDFDFVPQ